MSTVPYGFLPTEDFANPDKFSLGDYSDIVGDGAGELVRLYKYYEKTTGGILKPRDQFSTSSCVGQATALAADLVAAIAISGLGQSLQWRGHVSAECVYAGSRYEIGRMRHGLSLRGKGSHVPYAAEFVCDYGLLFQQRYGLYDLSTFNVKRCNEWERSGVPDDLEPIMGENAVVDWSPINSYEELRGALKNGHPCVVGSAYGFKGQPYRNEFGMLKPKGKWMHAMTYVAYDEIMEPYGVGVMNSWGVDWVGGPKRYEDDPDGMFWIEPEVAHDMCRKGEVVALSGVKGLKRRTLRYELL